MDLSFIFFIFAAFIVIPGTFFILAIFNKYLAAGIASLGMLVLFILFGIQFYNADGTYVKPTVTTNWPPSINYCPDYLTLRRIDSNCSPNSNIYVCYDSIGVGYGTNSIQQYNDVGSNFCPRPDQTFNLYIGSNDNDRRDRIIDECKSKKVTWEGIYDGLKSYKNVVPKPPQ